MTDTTLPPLPTGAFVDWFYGEEHRRKYAPDHPAFLAASEAWSAAILADRKARAARTMGLADEYARQAALQGMAVGCESDTDRDRAAMESAARAALLAYVEGKCS